MSRLSILTPTYKHAAFLPACLDSALAQAHRDWEMVLLDDGSPDDTPSVVRRYADPRIRYHRQDNLGLRGLGTTYNRALALANGDLVAILEGDDLWPPDKLARLVPAFDDSRVVLAYGITRHVDAAGRETGDTTPTPRLLARAPRDIVFNDPPGSAVREMVSPDEGVFCYPVSVVIRRSALDAIGGFRAVDDGHAVDTATFMTLALKGTFHFTPHVTGYWRRHPGQQNSSRALESALRSDFRFVIDFLERHRDELPAPMPTIDGLRRRWAMRWAGVRIAAGRHLLLRRQWTDARREFLRALDGPISPVRTVAACAGLACSYARRDLEWLYRGAGRGDWRAFYDTSAR